VSKAEADSNAGKRPRRIRKVRVSMATRLAASVVIVSFTALVIATIVGLNAGRSLGEDIYENRLDSLESSGAFDVASQLRSTSNTATALAASPQAVIALDEFNSALDELDSELPESIDLDQLIEAYQERYIAPLEDAGRPAEIRSIVPEDSAATYLQSKYAIDLGVIKQPSFIDDAGDGTRWSEIHKTVHPVYRGVIDQLELLDLYLIEPTTGRVVYSVGKKPDLGTALNIGPFSGSVLATTVDRVINNPENGTVSSDLSFYNAVPGTPVGVVASPVMDGDRLVGVLALMYDGLVFTDLLTADGNWEQAGFPETGDTYLVGLDGTTRSDPRPFLENEQLYLDKSQEFGLLSDSQRTTIEAVGTTVLTQSVVDATFTAAIDGNTNISKRVSLTGQSVFGLVAQVPSDEVTWYVVSELSTAAAERGLDDFQNILVVGASIFIVAIAFFAVAWANTMMRPVRAISERLGSNNEERAEFDVAEKSPIELQNLASSFESMSETLDRQQVNLAIARESRLNVMRRMLPSAVAERIAAGDLQTLDEVSHVSVVVLVVLGLNDLVHADSGDRDLIEQAHAELDELAEQHGLDRIKVVGDAYFAACGHDRPYIDHAPRSIAFAAEAHEVLVELSADSPADLDVAIGIDTGSVNVGMTGGARLIYDVWGPTVTIAHNLARRAARGEVLMTTQTKDLLPPGVATTLVSGSDAETELWSVATATIEGVL
jgi:class 3 adenylate cyclase